MRVTVTRASVGTSRRPADSCSPIDSPTANLRLCELLLAGERRLDGPASVCRVDNKLTQPTRLALISNSRLVGGSGGQSWHSADECAPTTSVKRETHLATKCYLILFTFLRPHLNCRPRSIDTSIGVPSASLQPATVERDEKRFL